MLPSVVVVMDVYMTELH